jgi:hypothetical protein
MQIATQELERWRRRVDYLENEAIHARYRYGEEATAKIFDDGADNARRMVEWWSRNINGAK